MTSTPDGRGSLYEPYRNLITSVKILKREANVERIAESVREENSQNQSLISSHTTKTTCLVAPPQSPSAAAPFDLLRLHGNSVIQVAYNDRRVFHGEPAKNSPNGITAATTAKARCGSRASRVSSPRTIQRRS